jgi:hypothetical protein
MSTMTESPLVLFRGVILIRYFGWMCGLQYIDPDFGLLTIALYQGNFPSFTQIDQVSRWCSNHNRKAENAQDYDTREATPDYPRTLYYALLAHSIERLERSRGESESRPEHC